MWARKWWFKRKLRKERAWREFLEALQPPPQPSTPPDMAGVALNGAAQLISAFTSAEVERLKATEVDREREFAAREEQRKAAREARREAAAKRRDPVTGRLRSGVHAGGNHAPCRVCMGSINIAPSDVDRHYAEGHEAPRREVVN